MKRSIDVHGFKRRLVEAERLLDVRNPISARNAGFIKRFEDSCFSEGLSEARVVKYLQSLRKIAEWLGKEFDEATKADLERLVGRLVRSDYSAWTKHD